MKSKLDCRTKEITNYLDIGLNKADSAMLLERSRGTVMNLMKKKMLSKTAFNYYRNHLYTLTPSLEIDP